MKQGLVLWATPLVSLGTAQAQTIDVTSEPPGARIFVDQKDIDRTTPVEKLTVTPGQHNVEVVFPDGMALSSGGYVTSHKAFEFRKPAIPDAPSNRSRVRSTPVSQASRTAAWRYDRSGVGYGVTVTRETVTASARKVKRYSAAVKRSGRPPALTPRRTWERQPMCASSSSGSVGK